MTNAMKTIKYLAMALAIFLAVSIISGIVMGISSIGRVFEIGSNDKEDSNLEIKEISKISDAKILNVDVGMVNIIIKRGDNFRAESSNEYIEARQDNDILYIKERSHNFKGTYGGDLIIYVPEDYLFDIVKIDNGAGKIDIEEINTRKIDLDLGAGRVNIKKMFVKVAGKISSGAGELTITDSEINEMDFDMGAGKVTINAKITGDSEIDAGVGALNLNLYDSEEDYQIKVDKGIGKITYIDREVTSGTYGNGVNEIDIDGGIGTIKISFLENKIQR